MHGLDKDIMTWKARVRSYRRSLGLKDNPWKPGEYKITLSASQNQYSDDPDQETMQPGTKELLEKDEMFKRWLSCQYSSMLIITAINHANCPLRSSLWLSPALVDFAEDNLTDDNSHVIFHPIQANQNNPLEILFAIVCEILDSSQDLFLDHDRAVLEWISVLKDTNKTTQKTSSTLFVLIESLVQKWCLKNENRSLFIIVDRLDFYLENSSVEKEALRKVMKLLAHICGTCGVNGQGILKVVFLAAHNIRWPLWEFDDWNVSGEPDKLLRKLEWRQGDCT